MAATRNATEVTTIQSIRNLEHRDAEGNIISEMPPFTRCTGGG